MALTQDQAEMLQTAVDNLNQSVEVNKQVLEICKSVGNTGAVDISLHNNDANAHSEGLTSVFAKNYVYAGSKTFTASGSEPCAIRLGNTSTSGSIGNAIAELYSRLDNETYAYPAIRFNNVFSGSVGAKSIGFLGARVYDTTTSNYVVRAVLNMRHEAAGHYALYLSLDNTAGEGVTDGSETAGSNGVTQVWLQPSYFGPNAAIDLGSSTYQWKDAYLTNSPIVSSDRRLKQNFETVPEAVFKAWASVNFQVYKFKEAVAKKGEASARKHVGLVAQDIIEAFEAQGLNAFDYGIVCHDEWEDQYVDEQVIDSEAVYDKDGKLVTPEKSHTEKRFVKAAGDVYTVRYEEALALEAAYQRWKLGKIEQALAAKGITL